MTRKRREKAGSIRGLGVRYGSTVRKRYLDVVTESKKTYGCPQCGFESIRRKSVGIWECGKCGLTFTGGAYAPVTKLGVVAKRVARSSASEKQY